MRTGSPVLGPVIGGHRHAVLNNAAIPAFRTQVRLACGSADCALTRRGKMGIEPSTLTAGDFSLDRSSFELASSDGSTPLANKEFQIMELLMRNRGGYLSIDRLIELVWGFGSAAEPNVVRAHISNLRRKIESVGSKARIVASRTKRARRRTLRACPLDYQHAHANIAPGRARARYGGTLPRRRVPRPIYSTDFRLSTMSIFASFRRMATVTMTENTMVSAKAITKLRA